MISNPTSLTGDIILFISSKESLNTFAQSVLRRKKAMHCHVAIAIKQGNAIHAMPATGVQLEGIRDILKDENGSFVVFRNDLLEFDEELLCRLEDELLFHSRQSYNFGLFFNSSACSSFCSELAAKAFENVGLRISGERPVCTLPVDIYEFVSLNREWRDVTQQYKDFFLDVEYDGGHDLVSKFVRDLELKNQDMALGQVYLLDKIKRVEISNGLIPSEYKPTRDYWSNDEVKRLGVFFTTVFLLKYWWRGVHEMVRWLYMALRKSRK